MTDSVNLWDFVPNTGPQPKFRRGDPWVRIGLTLNDKDHSIIHATVECYKPGDIKPTYWFGRAGTLATTRPELFKGTSLVRLSDDASDIDVARKALDHAWACAAGLNAPCGVEWADTKTHIQMCILGLAE